MGACIVFLTDPTEFLFVYYAVNGIPKTMITDPGTVFESEKFKHFCKELIYPTYVTSSKRLSRKWKCGTNDTNNK